MMGKHTTLHANPFCVLGVTTRDDRHKIVEMAGERELHLDHDLCQKARSDLTNPRARLSAEMAWMPGVSPRMAEKLTKALSEDPLSVRSEEGLPVLARANLMAAAFELVEDDEPAESIAEFVRNFAWVVETIDTEKVLRDVNEDRAVSGFPEVKGLDAIEEEFAKRRKAYRSVLKGLLDSMDPNKLVETMTDTVAVATDGGEDQGPALIDELIDTYEIESQGFLQKEYENIIKLIENAREAAPRGEKSVAPIVDKLGKVARNWDRVAQPIQLSAKSRGIAHRSSNEVAYNIRSLGIDLYNEHGMLEQAHRIIELLQELFAESPEMVEKLGEDAETISNLRRQAQEKERNKAQRKPTLTSRDPDYRGKASSSRSSDKWKFLPMGLVVAILLVAALVKHNLAQSPSNTAAAPESPYPASVTAAPVPEGMAPAPAAADKPAYVPEPAPTNTSNDEEKPPVGNGLVFNSSQIRYCLSADIRVSAWKSQVNDYSETSVNAFNEAVNDYNMRCSHFRYRSGTIESIRSEVEANRYALIQQGMASAAANP